MAPCRWRRSIEASLNHSPWASSLSACSPPPGCSWLSARSDVSTTPARNLLPLPFECRNPLVDRCSAIALREPRDSEEIVQLPIRQLRQQIAEEGAAVFADRRRV